MASRSLVIGRSRRWTSRGASYRAALAVACLPLVLFLLVPLGAMLVRVPPQTLLTHLVDDEVAQAILLSITTTLASTALTIVIGTPVAFALARGKFRGRAVLDTLLDLPMVLPPSVAGIALLVAFGRRGVIGQHLADVGVSIAFTQLAVVLAQLFVSAPLYVKSAATGLRAVDPALEQAAAIDGASPLNVFWLITVPLAFPSLLGGAVMSWARALGEFGATIIFAGNFPGRTQTMPLAIYIGFELDLSVALTLSALLLAASFGVLFVVKFLLRQRETIV